MGLDYTTSFISLATALSLAGWAAYPGSQQQQTTVFPNQQEIYNNIDFNGNYHRFQPYPRQHRYWNQYQNYGTPSQSNINFNNFDSSFYQTKDAQQNFLELQDLVSWQDAYRRGDFNPNRQPNFILPVLKKEEEEKEFETRTPSSHSLDDGYLSGDASAHSPSSSVFSGYSPNANFLDDLNVESFSPSSIENDIFELEGAVGGVNTENAEFDIDRILFGDEQRHNLDFLPPQSSESTKSPFDNLFTNENLNFVEFPPHKSPLVDQFLASPNPGYKNDNTFLESPHTDPFQMEFLNSSDSESKALPNGMEILGDLDPSVLDDVLALDDGVNIDKISDVSSPAKKTEVPSFLEGLSNLHDEFGIKPKLDERYGAKSKINFFDDKSDENKMSPRETFSNIGERTFTPISAAQNTIKGKYKKQKRKAAYVWPNFPYTFDELIEMPVESFNEVIKTLNEVQQHEAKDIRRKGKNKLAARNCRKRKMEIIDHLDAGVSTLEKERARLYAERQSIIEETRRLRKGTEWLNNYIFEHLRDPNGSPYSPTEYSLQYTLDGNVYLVPSGQPRTKTSLN